MSSLGDTDFDVLEPLKSEPCYDSLQHEKLRISLGGGATPTPPDDLKPDLPSYEWAAGAIHEILEKDPQTRQVLVTVEGVIYDGGPEPSGVTRHPWYPAFMFIASWKQVEKP